MLKTNRKTLIITSIVILLPILTGVFFWKQLPDVMATHFGADNEANGFSSKAFAVFGIPAICLAIHWFAAIVTSRDPRRQNISPKMFTLVLWIIPIISIICAIMEYPYNLGHKVDVTYFSEIFVGLFFIVVGNYLPKTRQNYTIGIKIPWTLENEENWNRTHRIAGYLWLTYGILIVILALFGVLKVSWMFTGILVAIIVPFVYSYWLHAKKDL